MLFCHKTTNFEIITFNDPNFLNAILSKNPGVDTDGDGRISIAEAEACTRLNVRESSISDMSEIKYFTNLTYLNCIDNQLTQLDVSNNAQLTELYCYDNQLTYLDVSNNMNLTNFMCWNNPLTKLVLAEQHKSTEWYEDVYSEYSSVLTFDAQ